MEQVAQNIGTIIGIIAGITLFVGIIGAFILAMIYDCKTNAMRRELINKMNEHDKSVIMTYKNTFWSIKKHDSNNNSNGN